MADVSVFGKVGSISDYQRQKEAMAMKQQLMRAQIGLANKQANEIDVDKLGERAFMKAAQGLELTPQELAAAQYVDAKSGGVQFNPVTGAMLQKPRISERIGLPGMEQPQAAPAMPQAMPPQGKVSPDDAATLGRLFNTQPITPKPVGAANPKLDQMKAEEEIKANSPNTIFERENKLRDEFNTLTKDFRTVQDAYTKIGSTSDSAAGDLSLLYQYNKLLDPNSVVRESEFATVASSGSLGERMQSAVQRIMTGERLTPEQRAAFKNEALNIYSSQKQGYERTKGTYKGLAERSNANIQNVITDYTDSLENDPLGLRR